MKDPGQSLRPFIDERNREQKAYWATDGAQQYREYSDTNEALFAPFGRVLLDAAQLKPGERVLDVGCGHGASTFEAAEQVSPTGRVVGVDISPAMLQHARRQVADAGVDNVELLEADAQVYAFEPGSFDAVISRFGTMFFDDMEAAFENLARAVRPDGRLVFVCWRDSRENEWVRVALGAAVATLGRAPDLGPPGAPGPFALADGDRLAKLLAGAGFRDVSLDKVTRPVRIGRDCDHAVAFVLSLPQSQELFAGAPREVVAAVTDNLGAAFAPFVGSRGVVMDAAAWLVSARR